MNVEELDIDAVQMEFGARLRLDTRTRESTAMAVARAIAGSEYVS